MADLVTSFIARLDGPDKSTLYIHILKKFELLFNPVCQLNLRNLVIPLTPVGSGGASYYVERVGMTVK